MKTFEDDVREAFDGKEVPEAFLKSARIAWHWRDAEVADLERQLKENEDEVELKTIAAKGTDKLLEPSPCGVAGHRRADWVDEIPRELFRTLEETRVVDAVPAHCLACCREADIQRQLEPSPCGVARHRKADWVDHSQETDFCQLCNEYKIHAHGHCASCNREQEIRREERELIALACERQASSILGSRLVVDFIRALPGAKREL